MLVRIMWKWMEHLVGCEIYGREARQFCHSISREV
jgi:hypothetical protein